jgi:hypothetical protein
MICIVSTPEVVARAHAQAQVEAVILHTLFSTLTFYSQFFFGACRLTQSPTSKWGCLMQVLISLTKQPIPRSFMGGHEPSPTCYNDHPELCTLAEHSNGGGAGESPAAGGHHDDHGCTGDGQRKSKRRRMPNTRMQIDLEPSAQEKQWGRGRGRRPQKSELTREEETHHCKGTVPHTSHTLVCKVRNRSSPEQESHRCPTQCCLAACTADMSSHALCPCMQDIGLRCVASAQTATLKMGPSKTFQTQLMSQASWRPPSTPSLCRPPRSQCCAHCATVAAPL